MGDDRVSDAEAARAYEAIARAFREEASRREGRPATAVEIVMAVLAAHGWREEVDGLRGAIDRQEAKDEPETWRDRPPLL